MLSFNQDMEYKDIAKHVKELLRIVYTEFGSMLKKYDKNYIYKKSIPYKVSKKHLDQKDQINNQLKKIYFPVFDTLYPMIQCGIIECVPENNEENELLKSNVLNDGMERLYSFQLFRYNLQLSFIMQLYLFVEQNMVKFFYQYFGIECNTILDLVKKLEHNYKFTGEVKNKINMYKDIINVFKHGYGNSYNNIANNYKYILNKYNNQFTKNNDFIFDSNTISLKELYDTFNYLLNTIIGSD